MGAGPSRVLSGVFVMPKDRSLETTIEWYADPEADGTALVGFPKGTAFAGRMLAIMAARPGEAKDAYPPSGDGSRLVRVPRKWVRVVPGRGQKGKPVPPPWEKSPRNMVPEVGITWAEEGCDHPDLAHVYCTDVVFARALGRLGIKPERVEDDGAGPAHYRVPVAWVKVRPPRAASPAQIEAARKGRAAQTAAKGGAAPARSR